MAISSLLVLVLILSIIILFLKPILAQIPTTTDYHQPISTNEIIRLDMKAVNYENLALQFSSSNQTRYNANQVLQFSSSNQTRYNANQVLQFSSSNQTRYNANQVLQFSSSNQTRYNANQVLQFSSSNQTRYNANQVLQFSSSNQTNLYGNKNQNTGQADYIDEAKRTGIVTAEIDISNGTLGEKSFDNTITVRTEKITNDIVSITLTATNQTGSRIILISMTGTVAESNNLRYLNITYDTNKIFPTKNINSILQVKSTDEPSYALIINPNIVNVLVSIPHFTTHVIILSENPQNVLPVQGSPNNFNPFNMTGGIIWSVGQIQLSPFIIFLLMAILISAIIIFVFTYSRIIRSNRET